MASVRAGVVPPAGGRWTTLSASERESFLAAIARHRRASWRVTAACAVAVAIVAMVVAILMAPLLYCLIGLAFDVVNLVRPAPDVLGRLGREIDALTSGRTVPAAALAQAAVIASLPGLLLILILTAALRRVWKRSPLFDAGDVAGRAPDRTVLAEERLANIVEEMAIAAGIPVPRIVIVPGGTNAAACGRDRAHVTLLVGEALPGGVAREQLEGMIAHLIASVVNGDMKIGLRVTTTMSLFWLAARTGTGFGDREALRNTLKLGRVIVAPTSTGALDLLNALTDPFGGDGSRTSRAHQQPAAKTKTGDGLTLGDWLLMPLMGPIVLSGFLAGMVTQFFLQPLIALAWRQRKYMADATAVQLTRDPDGLASALTAIADTPMAIATWTAHLAVAADSGDRGGPFGGSIVPIFPSLERRVAALDRMGAHVTLAPHRRMPWPIALAIGVVGFVVAGLMALVVYLLVILSAAISGLFTIVPAAILHALLRWLAR